MAQINKPTDYFNTVTYTGNGGTQSVTGVGFQPDWCWIKSRSNPGVYGHEFYDVIRGVRNSLSPNSTGAEFTIPTTSFESFDSDGFTVQLSDNYARGLNENNQLHVAWNWKAGGTASSNTDGSITSQVSANTTSGFSIVSYTGSGSSNETVGHGLNSAPTFIILKPRSEARDWLIWSKEYGDNDKAMLFDTGTPADNRFGPNAPTSSVFGLYGGQGNRDGTTFVAYCFHDVKGFSKFGSYTGSGNADGTFVYTGFKPAFVICKRTDGVDDWFLLDNKRDIDNPVNHWLMADNSNAEQTSPIFFDFLSNGFKNRGTGGGNNASGGTYIYMAIAEQPLVGTNNIPSTAR